MVVWLIRSSVVVMGNKWTGGRWHSRGLLYTRVGSSKGLDILEHLMVANGGLTQLLLQPKDIIHKSLLKIIHIFIHVLFYLFLHLPVPTCQILNSALHLRDILVQVIQLHLSLVLQHHHIRLSLVSSLQFAQDHMHLRFHLLVALGQC